MIGQTISHYRVLSELGKGGMGTVYLAEHTLLGRRVAIKTLNVGAGGQHYRARFLREARTSSALSHPNIATVHDYGETPDGHPFIVMELIEGQTLDDLISEGGLTLARAVEIGEKIAEALAEAHRHGIIHRDIKPANVAVNRRAEVKVLDFGLAKQLLGDVAASSEGADAQALPATATREDVIIGTPSYLSPEQALGLPVDQRSDLFSWGAVFYECLTGQIAFPGESAAVIRAKVVRDDPPPPSHLNPGVPAGLDRIVMKALAKKPERRYQHAGEVLADLRALPSATPREDDPPVPRRRPAAPHLHRSSALTALSEAVVRPRVLAAAFLSTFAVALALAWAGWLWPGAIRHTPSTEARRLYDKGAEALRNGSYHTASLLLQEAVKSDDEFPLAHARLAEAWSELDYPDRAKDEIIRVGRLVPERSALPPTDALYLEAITDTVARDYPGAVRVYLRIAQQAPEASKAEALLDVGRAYEKAESLEEAIKNYRAATEHDRHYAAAFLRLGAALGRKQELPGALAAFDEAERLYQTFGNLEGVTEVMYRRGSLFNKLRKLGEARAALDAALDKAQATGNVPQRIMTLLQLSTVVSGQGDVRLAQKYAADAVSLAQGWGMENLTAGGLIDLGNVFFAQGNFAEAESYFKQALGFARNSRARRNEARASLSLGSLYSNLGRKDEARRFTEQALPFYREGGYRKEVSQGLTVLGHLNDHEGEYGAALAAFDEQVQLTQQTGDESQAALAHLGAGLVLLHQERFPEALERFDASLALHRKLGVRQNIGHLLVHRGHALLQSGRLDEARGALAEAEQLGARAAGYEEFNALLSLQAARAALVESRTAAAAAESRKALALAGEKFWAIATEANYVLGLAETRRGAASAGAAHCGAAESLAEKFGDPRLLAYSLLARAESYLGAGDARSGGEAARRALETFERLGQLEAASRAALLAARAERTLGVGDAARDYEQRAASFFNQFRLRLPEGAVDDYLARPDVQHFRRQALAGSTSHERGRRAE